MTEKQTYEKLTKDNLVKEINKVVKRETRVIANFNEEMTNRSRILNRQLDRARKKSFEVLPSIDGYREKGMFYYRSNNLFSGDQFAIASRRNLKIDKYQMGIQIYSLPNDYKLSYNCVLLGIFDANHKFLRYGLLSSRLNQIDTFHSTPTEICLGANKEAFKVEFSNSETLVKGFDSALETLETINPSSYLSNNFRSMPNGFSKTGSFIREQCNRFLNRGNDNDEEDVCVDCEENIDNCICDNCENCGLRFNSHNYDNCNCANRR